MSKFITINEEKLRESIINQIIKRYTGEITIKGDKNSYWWKDARDPSLGGTNMTISGNATASKSGNGIQIDVTYTLACSARQQ